MGDSLFQLFIVCDKWCFLTSQIMLVPRVTFKVTDDILSYMDWESCKEQELAWMFLMVPSNLRCSVVLYDCPLNLSFSFAFAALGHSNSTGKISKKEVNKSEFSLLSRLSLKGLQWQVLCCQGERMLEMLQKVQAFLWINLEATWGWEWGKARLH